MITDNIISIIDFIGNFISIMFPNVIENIERLDYFLVNITPQYINQFNIYMSYVYYFIPKDRLQTILVIVGVTIGLRIITAIINLIYP